MRRVDYSKFSVQLEDSKFEKEMVASDGMELASLEIAGSESQAREEQ